MSLPLNSLSFRLLVLLASLLLVIGLTLPMMSVQQFYFFNNAFSVLSGIQTLFMQGKWLLAALIFVFSILLPLLKLAVLFLLSRAVDQTKFNRYLKLMHDYGRWAMLDVLVVAVLIVSVKLGAVVTVQVHAGLYVFATAVFLTMYLTHLAAKSPLDVDKR